MNEKPESLPPQTQTELLPCPFCGGAGELFQITKEQEPSNEGGWVVQCEECNASSRVHFSEKDDARPHVIGAWNDRAPSVVVGDKQDLLAALRDARATFMNLGIDNDTPRGLQLRKAAGRITEILDKQDLGEKEADVTAGEPTRQKSRNPLTPWQRKKFNAAIMRTPEGAKRFVESLELKEREQA